MSSGIKVAGIREVNFAFKEVGGKIPAEMRATLRAVAEPVRSRAEQLGESNITNIGSVWERMRVGVTASSVYVAPKTRRKGGSPRPNLAPLLLNEAMEPALEQSTVAVVRGFDLMLGRLNSRF